jgi:hypothetical protein
MEKNTLSWNINEIRKLNTDRFIINVFIKFNKPYINTK